MSEPLITIMWLFVGCGAGAVVYRIRPLGPAALVAAGFGIAILWGVFH